MKWCGDSQEGPQGMSPYLPAQPQHPLPVSSQFSQLVAQHRALQDFCKRNQPGWVWEPLGSHLPPLPFLTCGNEDGAAPAAPVAAPVGELVPELDLEGAVPPQGAGHWSGVTGSGGG